MRPGTRCRMTGRSVMNVLARPCEYRRRYREPEALAVLRLIDRSNFVGCSTGRSAALAPLKILSTYAAARWKQLREARLHRPCQPAGFGVPLGTRIWSASGVSRPARRAPARWPKTWGSVADEHGTGPRSATIALRARSKSSGPVHALRSERHPHGLRRLLGLAPRECVDVARPVPEHPHSGKTRERLPLSISSRLPLSSRERVVSPVTLPPGRARVATNPRPTGSPPVAMTIGMLVVAFFAARAAGLPAVTTTSTLRRTSSSANVGSRSSWPSTHRTSKATVCPSTYPSSRRRSRNAFQGSGRTTPVSRYPMRDSFPGCCASVESGAARRPRATAAASATRLIVMPPPPYADWPRR